MRTPTGWESTASRRVKDEVRKFVRQMTNVLGEASEGKTKDTETTPRYWAGPVGSAKPASESTW